MHASRLKSAAAETKSSSTPTNRRDRCLPPQSLAVGCQASQNPVLTLPGTTQDIEQHKHNRQIANYDATFSAMQTRESMLRRGRNSCAPAG